MATTTVNASKLTTLLLFILLSQQGIGFVEQDSAGQTNIFAVEPKSYVKGSNTDGTDNSANDTLSLAAVAGTVAAGAIVAGLITISGSFSDEVVPAPSSEYKSLTAYSAQFTAELAAAAPVAAPELTSE